ncbi:MAG: glycosyl transferase, partial [Deltaproteobacteria bacterium]|nr:glycosyl transferase [Deltaproteobacteria bacterium]
MADFHQEGIITTLHALYEVFDREEYLTSLERKLEEYSRHLRISLLLPCFYTELQNPQVLNHIMDEIQQVSYLKCVVVAFNGTSEEAKFQEAREYFKKLQTSERDVKLVWVDGPRIQSIFQDIQKREIHTGI